MTHSLLVALLFLSSNIAAEEELSQPSWWAPALHGIELTLNEEFDRAYATYDSLEKAHPRRPEGPLGQGMVLYNKSLLLKTDKSLWKQAHRHLDRGIDCAEDWADDHGDSVEMFYWLGSAHALKASLHVYQDDMIDAVMAGLRAREFLKASIEQDPEAVDARFGLAFTEYMAARSPRFLTFVARLFNLPSGDRAGSLAEMDRVAREGVYTKSIARTTRAYLELYFERHPGRALEMFRQLRVTYPLSIDYGIRELDCMLALTVTGRDDFSAILADSAAAIEASAAARSLELDEWLQTKLLFVGGYGNYLQGHYEKAQEQMDAYVSESHRKSWIRGPSHLVLGKIADLRGERDIAVQHYRKVLKTENVWGAHLEAEEYLKDPFEGDEKATRPMDTETRFPQTP